MQLIVFVADQPASLDEYKSHLSRKKGHNFISREDDSNALFEVYFSMDSQVAVAMHFRTWVTISHTSIIQDAVLEKNKNYHKQIKLNKKAISSAAIKDTDPIPMKEGQDPKSKF